LGCSRRLHRSSHVFPQGKSERLYEIASKEEKAVSGTVADMGATSGLPSTMLVLSMLLFVRSLHVDGTGYADT
jgi:hypothetical protein